MTPKICTKLIATVRNRERHPSLRRLLDYVTLPGLANPKIAGHLEKCENCRRKVAIMERDWMRLLVLVSATYPAEGKSLDSVLKRILTTIRKSDARMQVPPQWLVKELRIYLGRYSDSLAQSAGSSDPRHLMAQTGALLSTFLGRKAAAGLTDRALNAIVRPL